MSTLFLILTVTQLILQGTTVTLVLMMIRLKKREKVQLNKDAEAFAAIMSPEAKQAWGDLAIERNP